MKLLAIVLTLVLVFGSVAYAVTTAVAGGAASIAASSAANAARAASETVDTPGSEMRPWTSEKVVPEPKRLERDLDNAVIGGVCAGIANYFGIDKTLVRIIFLCVPGIDIGVYFLLWILVPAVR